MTSPRRQRGRPIVVEAIGAPVVVSGIARLLLARRRDQQARKPSLVIDNDKPSGHLREIVEGHQRRFD